MHHPKLAHPHRLSLLALGAASVMLLTGCPGETAVEEPPVAEVPAIEEPAPAPEQQVAIAELQAGPEGTAGGTVTFTQKEDGSVEIVAEVHGVEAAASHGFHLHETGECTGDFSSAGGHFNPTGADHGAPDDQVHHAGDFGNIEIDAEGRGHLELTSDMLSVDEGPSSVVGKAVILHAGTDDLTTQPTGDAGARIACGVVRLADEMGADVQLSPTMTEAEEDAALDDMDEVDDQGTEPEV